MAYEDKWILSKMNNLISEVTENIDSFEFGVYAQKVYDFIWNEFCDWYIEMVKPRLYSAEDNNKIAAQFVLNKVLENSLKLLHPIMPFVTEEIYTKLYNNYESIMISDWPKYEKEYNYTKEAKQVEELKNLITGIRNIRTQRNVHPAKKTKLVCITTEYDQAIKSAEP